MRGAIGRRLSNPSNGFSLASIVKHAPFLVQPTSHFSSSSSDGGAGRGRGRGRGGSGSPAAGAGQFGFNREPEKANEPQSQSQSPGGYGHGRGRPIQSDPISPPFSSFVKPDSLSVGRGRGSLGSDPVSPFSPEPPRHPAPPQPQQTRFEPAKDGVQGSPPFAKLEATKDATSPPPPGAPNNISNALGSGAGRGKPDTRHIQRSPQRQKRVQPPKDTTPRPQLSPEEAGRRARSQLSRGEAEGGSGGGVKGRGGGRGRGRGARGRGRGRGGEGWRDDKKEEEAEQEALSVFVGDNADGEKFAKKMGYEIMAKLAEGYEDICERALPSKTAILPVNPTFLPRSEDEREKCTRTIYCTNVDKNATEDDVRIFFESACGEVTRIRLLGDQLHSTRIAFVEFAIADSAVAALSCSGVVLGSQPIRVSPSKTPVRSRFIRSPFTN